MSNEFAAVLAALALLGAAVYAGVKKAFFQMLAAVAGTLFVVATAIKEF
jgi:nicotinamide riboside transporter PnuC